MPLANVSPLLPVRSAAHATPSPDWEVRVLAVGTSACAAIKSKAAAIPHGLVISQSDSLAEAFGQDERSIDALLIGFDGSANAERRLERLPDWLNAAIVALVPEDSEELSYQALKCGADEAVPMTSDIGVIACAVRRALARKFARDQVRLRSEGTTPLALVQETAEGLVILDHDGSVRFANDIAENLLGAEHGSLTGKPFRFPVSTGEPITADFPEGRSTELRFIETEWGGVPARIGSIADVTVRRELERAVDALEELQGRMADHDREFVSELSATIRRPLTNIVGFSELMLSQVFGPIGDERYSNYLKDVRDSGLAVVSVLQALEHGHSSQASLAPRTALSLAG